MISAAEKPFRVLEADPPWTYRTWSDKGNAIALRHYDLMTDEDLLALPIAPLMASDSVLFLWATFPKLPLALQVGQAWGFEYKTAAFVWVKRNRQTNSWFMGNGQSCTRANAEPCLFFSRGQPERLDRGTNQIVSDTSPLSYVGQGDFLADLGFDNALVAPVGRHSAKPAEAYRRMEGLFEGPRLRLFAREQRAGWTSMGNELSGLDIREELAAWS